ncbi:BppU family phage baseplate upper protein [Enterococcus faecium]|uniref:BppU family phage baseplate upper protein n=1 Tax=Enterococcus faecium TaxID=1352 RepID=UPI001C8C246D|nr:BppU family phage baseplate upper protein [Enterococcus faecium]MBX8957913.1 BppU family phage baseplate upper protein [Enterococcus faecium]
MANLEIKLSANKRQPYLRHRVVGRVGDGGLTTINVQLLEEDEITPFVINLNGTLKFVGEVSNGNYTEGEPEIIDSTNGLISYTFTKSNFSTSHQFKQAYFEYVDPNGKKVTFQNFIIDVLERVDINSEQAKYYISSLEKLQSEMQTTFNQFISDKQVQYDQIYSRYNELVRLINESNKQVNDRIDQTNQQIGDLGKLKKMYSNSLDFGGYDYSGNPNLMNNLSFSDFAVQAGGGTISDGGNFLKINKTSGTNLFVMAGYKNSAYYLTPILPNTTYTITYVLRKSANFVSQSGKRIFLKYRLNQNTTIHDFGEIILDSTNVPDEFTTYTKTFTTGALVNPNSYYFQLAVEEGLSGEIELNYEIKLERGSTATPYQPNLLEEPYYLSKVPLGENIANTAVQFPINSSKYTLYSAKMQEPFVVGNTYTITLEGTKPSTQAFIVYGQAVEDYNYGSMEPVEGLVNTWSLTFTPSKVSQDHPNLFQILQQPGGTVGACTIDWLKIEKGNTRTPNISQFKYFGEGLKDSDNPNDYSWDVTPEYTEKGLNNTVSLTEPQSIEGLKNFEDGIQSKGKSVLTSDDNKYEVVTLTVTNGNTGSAKLYREGKTVTIYFFALNGKSSGGNDSTILTIPEGYRPPISFEQLVGSIDRSTLNSAQLSIGADGAIKWRRNSSYGSDYTFAITYTI